MSSFISQTSEKALLALFPQAQGRADAPSWLVDQLVDAELHRRGMPDKVSGAFHALALTQGALLKEEYDISGHGHGDGWVMGAVLVDPVEFTLFNQRYGFAAGDAALRAMVAAMKVAVPSAKVVRTHTDGFALLLGPTADEAAGEPVRRRLRELLPGAVATAVPPHETLPKPWSFTCGLLQLTVVDPPNWQILGPLVWAECERALLIARRARTEALQTRRIEMNGRLPLLPAPLVESR